MRNRMPIVSQGPGTDWAYRYIMTEEQKYIFDIQGYIVLKDVVPQAVIDY